MTRQGLNPLPPEAYQLFPTIRRCLKEIVLNTDSYNKFQTYWAVIRKPYKTLSLKRTIILFVVVVVVIVVFIVAVVVVNLKIQHDSECLRTIADSTKNPIMPHDRVATSDEAPFPRRHIFLLFKRNMDDKPVNVEICKGPCKRTQQVTTLLGITMLGVVGHLLRGACKRTQELPTLLA